MKTSWFKKMNRRARRVARYFGPRRTYGKDGHQFEKEILGTCRAVARGDMKFWRAVDVARYNQPWDPRYPRGEAARLHSAVAKALNAEPTQVELYTAVGSSLDYYHGVDGFFVFKGFVVTLDVTLNPQGKSLEGADVLITDFDQDTDFEFVAREVSKWFQFLREGRQRVVV